MVAISSLAEPLPDAIEAAAAERATAELLPLPVGRPHLRLIQGGLDEAVPPPSIYRRRRLVALALAAALVVGAAAGALAARSALAGRVGSDPLTAPAAATSSGAPDAVVPTAVPAEATAVVVGPGDTLWGIARQITPEGGDVAATVDRLVARNGGVTRLVPGMALRLD